MDGAFRNRDFRRTDFSFDREWNGKRHAIKQIEAYAVEEDGWLVITVIAKKKQSCRLCPAVVL